MLKHFLATAATAFLVAACSPANEGDVAPTASTAAAPASRAVIRTASAKSGAGEAPTEIIIPSTAGEVTFRHQMHVQDLSIKCAECHHQINAKTLTTPHPDYFKSSWINCKTCHNESGNIKQTFFSCSACHNTNPNNIADETLSSKVVVHKQCWKCHPVNTGKDASEGCAKCHSGKKTL